MLAAGAVATAMVTAAIADPVKVGFVYLTNPGDHGWTYAHEVGRQDVEKHLVTRSRRPSSRTEGRIRPA